MIPDSNRTEWKELITGELKYTCSSFSLQMKINYLSQSYKNGFVSLPDAVKDLYTMCVKYEKIYQKDLEHIFNKKVYEKA